MYLPDYEAGMTSSCHRRRPARRTGISCPPGGGQTCAGEWTSPSPVLDPDRTPCCVTTAADGRLLATLFAADGRSIGVGFPTPPGRVVQEHGCRSWRLLSPDQLARPGAASAPFRTTCMAPQKPADGSRTPTPLFIQGETESRCSRGPSLRAGARSLGSPGALEGMAAHARDSAQRDLTDPSRCVYLRVWFVRA